MDRKADAFFWSYRYGARYCVVILDRTRHEWKRVDGGRVKQHWCREYKANTVRALRGMAAPWRLPRNTKSLCLAKIQ